MIERLQKETRWIIRHVEELDFPAPGTQLLLRLDRKDAELEIKGRVIYGSWDRQSRSIQGQFLNIGHFELELEADGDTARLNCLVSHRHDVGDVPCGSWSADEDGDGVVQDPPSH